MGGSLGPYVQKDNLMEQKRHAIRNEDYRADGSFGA